MHFPLVFFSPPGCNAHVGGCGGSTRLMPQIKINLIILNFTFHRAFNGYNMKRIAHGRIHHKFSHLVVEDAVDMPSNRGQEPVPWIKRLNMIHLTSSMACKKAAADQRNVIIIELGRFGSRKRTIYFAKRTQVSKESLVECLLGIFCLRQTKSVFSLP